MPQTIRNGTRGVLVAIRPIHRLKRESPEVKSGKCFGRRSFLRIYELEFISCTNLEFSAGLGTHTDPIEPRRRRDCPVRFHRDLKSGVMECFDERGIDLKEWLPAGEHDEPPRA